MSRTPLPEDRGLAMERTVMAWGRTSMALVGLAGLLVRFGVELGGGHVQVEVTAYAVAALTLITGGLAWWMTRDAYAHGRLPFLSRAQHRAFAAAACVVSVGTALTVLLGLL